MSRHTVRALALSAVTLVGLWFVTSVILQMSAGDPRLLQLAGWTAIGVGLGVLIPALRPRRVATTVAAVVVAAALGGRWTDLGWLSAVSSASFTWVVVGAVVARAVAVTAR